jgi:hypothetical protein
MHTLMMDGIRSINDTLFTEAIQESLGHLVRSIVLSDFLTQNEDFRIQLQFLRCVTPLQSVSDITWARIKK